MDDNTQRGRQREFDLVVLGATGVTGRLVVARLVELSRGAAEPLRWAVAGRSAERLTAALAEASSTAPAVHVDIQDRAMLAAVAARTHVLLNAAGPYSDTAEDVIEACIEAGTSYVDLSGEIPFLQRVNARFDRAAARAGVAIVQMAGWEAFPADLTTLVACHEASRGTAGTDGPGAAGTIRHVHVDVTFTRVPDRMRLLQSVSGGTVGSIARQLVDPRANTIRDPASLLPAEGDAQAVRRMSPFRFRPHRAHGRVLGPMIPVAFLNPPIVHRTAALLAGEAGMAHLPARYSEGMDRGAALGAAGSLRLLRATPAAVAQRALVSTTILPSPFRQKIASALTRAVPAGSGPSGDALTDWTWEVTARATARDGTRASATLRGEGHPGYTATASMIVATARALIPNQRTGCMTPALALGVDGIRALTLPGLRLVAEPE